MTMAVSESMNRYNAYPDFTYEGSSDLASISDRPITAGKLNRT